MDAFELVLTGGADARQYTAFVPDGAGGRAAEQAFEWRSDSVKLAEDLAELARAAIAGRPPQHDLHRAFGRQLFDTVFAGPVGELWRARRAAIPGHLALLVSTGRISGSGRAR